MMRYTLRLLPLLYVLFLLSSCKSDNKTTTNGIPPKPDIIALQPEEISLFDGISLSGWHLYNKKDVAIKNWTIVDSSIVCLSIGSNEGGGDLVSDKEYENFELSWEWKIDQGSNSGVLYHVSEDPKHPASYETGPEYQIIDDIGFPQKLEDSQKAASDYAMHEASANKKLKPVGEWNTSRIVFNKGHVEHWLNNEKVLEFDAWTTEWNQQKKLGKWKDYRDYGMAKKGKIALQDHGSKVYYRNIHITEL